MGRKSRAKVSLSLLKILICFRVVVRVGEFCGEWKLWKKLRIFIAETASRQWRSRARQAVFNWDVGSIWEVEQKQM